MSFFLWEIKWINIFIIRILPFRIRIIRIYADHYSYWRIHTQSSWAQALPLKKGKESLLINLIKNDIKNSPPFFKEEYSTKSREVVIFITGREWLPKEYEVVNNFPFLFKFQKNITKYWPIIKNINYLWLTGQSIIIINQLNQNRWLNKLKFSKTMY